MNLNKDQSIKFIRLSFSGNAVFISKNIKTEPYLQEMFGSALKEYLQALENLFVGKRQQGIGESKVSTEQTNTC